MSKNSEPKFCLVKDKSGRWQCKTRGSDETTEQARRMCYMDKETNKARRQKVSPEDMKHINTDVAMCNDSDSDSDDHELPRKKSSKSSLFGDGGHYRSKRPIKYKAREVERPCNMPSYEDLVTLKNPDNHYETIFENGMDKGSGPCLREMINENGENGPYLKDYLVNNLKKLGVPDLKGSNASLLSRVTRAVIIKKFILKDQLSLMYREYKLDKGASSAIKKAFERRLKAYKRVVGEIEDIADDIEGDLKEEDSHWQAHGITKDRPNKEPLESMINRYFGESAKALKTNLETNIRRLSGEEDTEKGKYPDLEKYKEHVRLVIPDNDVKRDEEKLRKMRNDLVQLEEEARFAEAEVERKQREIERSILKIKGTETRNRANAVSSYPTDFTP